MIKVYFFDHRHLLTADSNVAELSLEMLNEVLPVGATVVDETEADFFIAHFDTSELNDLEKVTNLTFHPSVQIVLCLTRNPSDRPGYTEQERRHRICSSEGKTRYILYARNVNTLKLKGTLEAFYKMGAAEAEEIVIGNWKNVAPPLRRLFHQTQIIYLSALAILFQGYLAAHAEYKGDKDWNDADIREALVEMAWDEYTRAGVQNPIREKLAESKDIVRKKEWLLRPFISRTQGGLIDQTVDFVSLRNNIEAEWDISYNGILPEPLEEFLNAMENEELKTVDSPKLIASAYLEISKRLSAG